MFVEFVEFPEPVMPSLASILAKDTTAPLIWLWASRTALSESDCAAARARRAQKTGEATTASLARSHSPHTCDLGVHGARALGGGARRRAELRLLDCDGLEEAVDASRLDAQGRPRGDLGLQVRDGRLEDGLGSAATGEGAEGRGASSGLPCPLTLPPTPPLPT